MICFFSFGREAEVLFTSIEHCGDELLVLWILGSVRFVGRNDPKADAFYCDDDRR